MGLDLKDFSTEDVTICQLTVQSEPFLSVQSFALNFFRPHIVAFSLCRMGCDYHERWKVVDSAAHTLHSLNKNILLPSPRLPGCSSAAEGSTTHTIGDGLFGLFVLGLGALFEEWPSENSGKSISRFSRWRVLERQKKSLSLKPVGHRRCSN